MSTTPLHLSIPAFLVLGLMLASCNLAQKDKPAEPASDDPIEATKPEAEFSWKSYWKLDSLRLEKAKSQALEIGLKNLDLDHFEHLFEADSGDSGRKLEVSMEGGFLFSPSEKHLLIENKLLPGQVFHSIFELKMEGTAGPILNVSNALLGFYRDSIFDVNGDGFRDFAIYSYPSAGCCLANTWTVYLFQPKTNNFSEPFLFINPTFFPQQQLIRGVGYGHSGETGLYTFRWEGNALDTVEYIFPYFRHHGQFIRTSERVYLATEKDGQVLDAIPKEYLTVEDLFWFTRYLKEPDH